MDRRRSALARIARWGAAAGALAVLAFVGVTARRTWRDVTWEVHPVRAPVVAGDRMQVEGALPGLVDVTLSTGDGFRLSGWYVPGTNGAAIVLVHGLWANRMAMLPEAKRLASRGYGVLLYDSRAHGNSEGDTCTWGDRERYDVTAAVDFTAARPEVDRIGAVGFSIGAYSVSGTAARDTRIRAVVLEAATPSFREEERWDDGPILVYPTLWLYGRFGLRVDEISVVASLKAIAPRPVLIVVGSEDPYILPWMTREVFAAAGRPKEIYVVPGAGHGKYAESAGNAYLDRLAEFFDTNLGPST